MKDVLSKARGDIEVIVVLDGYWPNPPLHDDLRLIQIHRGTALGMRPAINGACEAASGEYFLKLDAHCMMADGYDVALKADIEKDWVVVPRRYRLDPIAWAWQDVGKPPIDAHYLSYPYERPGDPACGLHGTQWPKRAAARTDILIDDEMSSQGSCWFMHRDQWARVGPLDIANYGNFIQEFQEIGMKTWLGGGAVKVNKKTWYAHLHKGKTYGRGYSMAGFNHERGRDFCTDYWMHDRWPQRVHDMRWLVEKFAPVPSWPVDLDQAFSRRGMIAIAPETLKNREALAGLFAQRGYTVGAEIGVAEGFFANILLKANPRLFLYAVDPWDAAGGNRRGEQSYQAALVALAPHLLARRVGILRKASVQALADVADRALDFVFIDGAHDYDSVTRDLEGWTPKVRSGGIVSGHDYYRMKNGTDGVIRAVDAFMDAHRLTLQIIPQDPTNQTRDSRQPCWWFEVPA